MVSILRFSSLMGNFHITHNPDVMNFGHPRTSSLNEHEHGNFSMEHVACPLLLKPTPATIKSSQGVRVFGLRYIRKDWLCLILEGGALVICGTAARSKLSRQRF